MVGVTAGLAIGETLVGSVASMRMPLPRSRLIATIRIVLGLSGLMGGFLYVRHIEKTKCKSGSTEEGILRFLRHAYVPVRRSMICIKLFYSSLIKLNCIFTLFHANFRSLLALFLADMDLKYITVSIRYHRGTAFARMGPGTSGSNKKMSWRAP